jgi:hypothetical protein
MLLGCLLGLLGADDPAPTAELTDALDRLSIADWTLRSEPVTRAGISAVRVIVDAGPGPARDWHDIDELLATVDLPATVVTGARRTFRLLAEVEAAQHRIPVDEVHFHEVGAVDAIVDIVGVWWLVDRLGVDRVVVGPVGIGHGTVRAAHGALPIPAPATAELLRGAPIRALDAAFETCTPTGAALLRSLGTWGPIPDGTIARIARGAGGKDPSAHPNVVSAILLEAADDDGTSADAVVLATNVDDVTPEVLARVVDILIRSGADDAWIVPIVMKKGRPAHQVCALVAPERVAALRRVLADETGTLGVRASATSKFVRPRRTSTVIVRGAELRMKIGPAGAKAEHDDLAALSDRTGIPVRLLAIEAAAEWTRALGAGEDPTNP